MRIMKFGGKSLDTKEKTQKICEYIKKIYKNDKKIIIIVSAIGSTTNNLCELAQEYSNKNPSKRELDVLLSTGETQSSALFSMMLNSLNVPTKCFQAHQLKIKTFGDYQNSRIAYINKSKLEECLNKNIIAVVSGFQGINSNNEITTLGRGGSDTTAMAIGAIFNQPVEIYSDYNGVYCGDPRVLNYKKLKSINTETMKKLSLCGAKVLDSRAVELAKKHNVKIISKQSSHPNKSGTIISQIESNTVSISAINNLCLISIVFESQSKLELIFKNVNNLYKLYKIYNLSVKDNILQILINQSDFDDMNLFLSKNLNLLKKNK